MQTIVLNLVGGPCAGKSTVASGVFYNLKCAGLEVELALEYAKDCVWNESFQTTNDQIYMFGKQYHKIWRLLGKVQVAIVDSPLLLSAYYRKFDSKYFDDFVVESYKQMNNVTYFVDRNTVFMQNGRVHTEEESKMIDKKLEDILIKYDLPYKHVKNTEAVDIITKEILEMIKNQKEYQPISIEK